MARWIFLAIGYLSFAFSLWLPTNVPAPGEGFYRGWRSFFWVTMTSLGRVLELVLSPVLSPPWPDWSHWRVTVIFWGLTNIWLLGAWLCLFSKSVVLRLIAATWGYAGFVILVISDGQSYHGFSASDIFLYLSYLFVATGILLSAGERLNREP